MEVVVTDDEIKFLAVVAHAVQGDDNFAIKIKALHTLDVKIHDIVTDSLAEVEIQMALQEQYQIDVACKHFTTETTLADLFSLVIRAGV